MSACGDGGDEKVTLWYAVWNKDQVPAMEKIVTAFEQSHPNIDVKVQLTPFEYWTKLQTAATGGSAPDVFWMNGPNFEHPAPRRSSCESCSPLPHPG